MTAHEVKPDTQPLIFKPVKDVERAAPEEKTEEQIRAEMKESVRRNARTLQTLSQL